MSRRTRTPSPAERLLAWQRARKSTRTKILATLKRVPHSYGVEGDEEIWRYFTKHGTTGLIRLPLVDRDSRRQAAA